MKLFYSWQSDSPNSTNRSFIRRCLDLAVEQIHQEFDVTDADRFEVDQDTQGVLGAPAVADTIFAKIKASSVFVADVSLVNATEDGKRGINSNVAVELGYAFGVLSDANVLLIMNTDSGPPADLPFDLSHRRFPVRYELNRESTDGERRSAQSGLVRQIKDILLQYTGRVEEPESNTRQESTFDPSAFWGRGVPLVDLPDTRGILHLANGGCAFLRVWPVRSQKELRNSDLSDLDPSRFRPLGDTLVHGGFSWERNRYGRITYSASQRQIYSLTQIFPNREIWGVDVHTLAFRSDERSGEKKIIPTKDFESMFVSGARAYVDAAYDTLGYEGPCGVEMGLVGTEGFFLGMSGNRLWGPIYEGQIVHSGEISEADRKLVDGITLSFLEMVYDASGNERPLNLYGFPSQA